jgi:hypothetical protein
LRICNERGRKRKSINLSLAFASLSLSSSFSLGMLSDTFFPAIRCTMLPKAYADALDSTPHPLPIAHAAQPTERGHQVLLLSLCTPVHPSPTNKESYQDSKEKEEKLMPIEVLKSHRPCWFNAHRKFKPSFAPTLRSVAIRNLITSKLH